MYSESFDLDQALAECKGAAKLKQSWDQFAATFNCMPDMAHATTAPIDEGQLRESFKAVASSLGVRTLPRVPQSGKWTKTGPALDDYMTLMCAVPLLSSAWGLAFGKEMHAESARAKADVEESRLESVAWVEVTNKRAQRSGRFRNDADSPAVLLTTAIIMEPLRWLTGYFLWASSLARRERRLSSPLLCSFTCADQSPITKVLQY